MENNNQQNLKKTTVLTDSITIEEKLHMVWEVVKDIGNIALFHPLIKSSHQTNDKVGVGAARNCKMKPMGEMDEEVVEWKEMSSFTTKVIGGKMLPPIEFMIGKLELTDLNNHTMATFTLAYRLKFGALGKIMDALLIKPQFKKAPSKYVEGLKEYVENMDLSSKS